MEYDNPILNERESTHGDYSDTAMIAQDLKSVVRGHSQRLNNTQAESLDLICTKIARILSGDPDCKDSWDDIAGYANLVGEKLTLKRAGDCAQGAGDLGGVCLTSPWCEDD